MTLSLCRDWTIGVTGTASGVLTSDRSFWGLGSFYSLLRLGQSIQISKRQQFPCPKTTVSTNTNSRARLPGTPTGGAATAQPGTGPAPAARAATGAHSKSWAPAKQQLPARQHGAGAKSPTRAHTRARWGRWKPGEQIGRAHV